jgi:hypothetical protein
VNRSTTYTVPFVPMLPLPVKVVRPFVAAIVMPVDVAALPVPWALVKAPAATEIVAVGPKPVAVNVAVYDVPEPEKPEIVP